GVTGVAFGAGRVEALAVVGQGVGVDREQHQVSVFAEHSYDCTARLFQSHGDGPAAETLVRFTGPDLDGFRGVLQLPVFDPRLASNLQSPDMFLIGPVQGNKRGKLHSGGWWL